jgi:hypothetical protein
MAVIMTREVLRLPAAQDEGSERDETHSRWLSLRLQALEPAISWYLPAL